MLSVSPPSLWANESSSDSNGGGGEDGDDGAVAKDDGAEEEDGDAGMVTMVQVMWVTVVVMVRTMIR